MERQSLFKILFVLLSLLILTIIPCLATGIQSPIGLTIYGNGNGGQELFWYYPGLHSSYLGNMAYLPDRVGFPSMNLDASILTRWILTPPTFIDSLVTFVSGTDSMSAYPGDQFTPLGASARLVTSPDTVLKWTGVITLDSGNNFSWSEVATSVGISYAERDELITSFDWSDPFFTAPQIGRLINLDILDQKYLLRYDNGDKVEECFEEYSAGLKLLSWTGEQGMGQARIDDQLSFELRYSFDTTDFGSNSILAGVADADSLHVSADIPDGAFLAVLARDSSGESRSQFMKYDAGRAAALYIMPSDFNYPFQPGEDNSYTISLENRGTEEIEVKIFSPSTFIVIIPETLSIPAGGLGSITVDFDASAVNDSIYTDYIIAEVGSEYYPVFIFMRFFEDRPLDIPSPEPINPETFQIGQPYPNPFNSVLSVPIYTSSRKKLTLILYNLLGQELSRKELTVRGNYKVVLDLDYGMVGPLSSAVYFLKIADDYRSVVRRVVYVK